MKISASKKRKFPVKTSSFLAAILGWVTFSVLNVFIFWQILDRAVLVRDNGNERIFNRLLTELRNSNDFGPAVEANPLLADRIIGIAVYENNLGPVLKWGKVPEIFDKTIIKNSARDRFGRYTIPDQQGRSVRYVLHDERQESRQGRQPPESALPPPEAGANTGTRGSAPEPAAQGSPAFLNVLFRNRYFYLDIYSPEYWQTKTLTAILFPLAEIIMLILVFYIRRLYLRNREYREKIEGQENLVVLGTAAGTLAHEIKNPLLSIRLQTGILEKLNEGKDNEELRIINQEVDRLSALTYRVNDYLREPAGEKAGVDIAELLEETSKRVFDIPIIINGADPSPEAIIFADENRIRSVLENIFRNARESGSPAEEIGVSLEVLRKGRADQSLFAGEVRIRIVDRGRGIPEKDLARVFDLFFTSKSTGTGIGLAVSKRFTEAAGGTISLTNRDGGGLAAALVFPLYTGEK